MAQQKQTVSRETDWFCPGGAVAIAGLAANAQFPILDAAFTNPIDSQSYDAGTIVGLRAWCDVYPDAVISARPYFVVMILPNGMAVPTVATEIQRKQNEDFIWFWGPATRRADDSFAAVDCFEYNVEIRSARKFERAE